MISDVIKLMILGDYKTASTKMKNLIEFNSTNNPDENKNRKSVIDPLTIGLGESNIEETNRKDKISNETYENTIAPSQEDLAIGQTENALAQRTNLAVAVQFPDLKKSILEDTSRAVEDDDILSQLDSLLMTNKGDDLTRRRAKKKEESLEEKILKEIEDLEDL
ncbi:MAG: hypothetical protein V1934_07500 [Methanobacteriota archaeon]